MSPWGTATLVAATITSGLTAGLFAAFSYSVMPALRRSDDRTFIEFMQNVNEVILNPVYMSCFVGGLAIAVAATATRWRTTDKAVRAWLIAGLAFHLAMLAITAGFHVPLNHNLAAAGNPDRINNPAAVRDAFEDKWVAANILRTLANLASFATFCRALILLGHSKSRTTAPDRAVTPIEQRPGVRDTAPPAGARGRTGSRHRRGATHPFTHPFTQAVERRPCVWQFGRHPSSKEAWVMQPDARLRVVGR